MGTNFCSSRITIVLLLQLLPANETMSEVAVAPSPADPKPLMKEEDSKPAATETPLSPSSSLEHRYERTESADDEVDDIAKVDDDDIDEGAKEEDALFSTIEKEQEVQGLPEQPKEVTAAPRLLQSALKAGEVRESDSDEEKKDNGEETIKSVEKAVSVEHHVHQRVSASIQLSTNAVSRMLCVIRR